MDETPRGNNIYLDLNGQRLTLTTADYATIEYCLQLAGSDLRNSDLSDDSGLEMIVGKRALELLEQMKRMALDAGVQDVREMGILELAQALASDFAWLARGQ
jgi:hypothetical protein